VVLENVQAAAAVILICVGVGFFSVPVALIVGGCLLLLDRLT